MRPLHNFYSSQKEPIAGCLLAFRQVALNFDPDITEAWKYNMPFFCYRDKMFCYLWVEAKTGQPYAGFVEGKWLTHVSLQKGTRSRMQIMYLDPEKDLPVASINQVMTMALALYKSGEIQLPKRKKTSPRP